MAEGGEGGKGQALNYISSAIATCPVLTALAYPTSLDLFSLLAFLSVTNINSEAGLTSPTTA